MALVGLEAILGLAFEADITFHKFTVHTVIIHALSLSEVTVYSGRRSHKLNIAPNELASIY